MSEKLSSNNNADSEAWDSLGNEPKTLMLGDVAFGDYVVVSMPYKNKDDAYEAIRESWQGVPDITTYTKDGLWYIVQKKF